MLACFTVPLLYDDEALLAALAAGGIVIGMFVPVRIKTALLLPAIFTAIVVGAWASLVCLLLAAFVGYGFSAYIIWKNRHQLFEKREDSE